MVVDGDVWLHPTRNDSNIYQSALLNVFNIGIHSLIDPMLPTSINGQHFIALIQIMKLAFNLSYDRFHAQVHTIRIVAQGL